MTIRRRALTGVSALLGAFVIGTSAPETAAPTLPPLTTLVPGGDLEMQQNVPVNVVLIGWDGVVDASELHTHLTPFTGGPDLRADGTPYLALRFDFNYNMVDTPGWFDDAFFGFLRQIAFAQPPQILFPGLPPFPMTPDQVIYNYCNVVTVTPDGSCDFSAAAPRANAFMVQQNHLLDGPFVENVLARNLMSQLGIDTRNPTVVLINWYGRDDYIDHVYIDPYEPNPATGEPRWVYFKNMIGGTGGTSVDDAESCIFGDCVPHRLWFHDLSAGPFFDTGSFDVTLAEPFLSPPPNGTPEYRIHHAADYLTAMPGTYRPIDTLVEDLARLVSDVYLAGIAFANPVYRTDIMPPRLPYRLQLDVNRWNWDPGASFDGQLNVPVMLSKMNALPYEVSAEITDHSDSRGSRLGDVYSCSLTSLAAYGEGIPVWGGFPLGHSCFGNRLGGYAGGDLYLYFKNQLRRYVEGDADYEVPVFQFMSTPDDLPDLAGLADDNYDLDNYHQQFLWLWTSSSFPSGHNQLLQHESGHHLGLSHPFHGYRCVDTACTEIKLYNGADDTFYSWNANAVSGVMGYTALNDDFSTFERDNLQRYRTWDYLRYSNEILLAIGKRNKGGTVSQAIADADALATAAVAAFQVSDHASAVQKARAAYDALLAAAGVVNANVPSPERALRRWHRARHASFRKYIANATTDLAANLNPQVGKFPVTSSGTPAIRLPAGISIPARTEPVPSLGAVRH